MTSEIEALGYVGLEVSDIERWVAFAEGLLGLQAVRREDGSVDLRLDDYATRVRLIGGPRDDIVYAGWEVRDASALITLEQRLKASGLEVERPQPGEAHDRRVAEMIRFRDPQGFPVEAFYGPLQKTDQPMVSPRGVRFKTGRQGLGHIVLSCGDKAEVMGFYVDQLGFRISDHIQTEVVPGRPIELSFLRCNQRHHSLALAPVPIRKRLVHLMVEVMSVDDVGRALYRCMDAGVHLSMTLGRHSNDGMFSFYPLTPSGFDLEYGWDGVEVDDNSWHVLTHDKTSAWGHVFQRPPRKPEAAA